ncbi:glycosyltransferase [Amnibacterium kyonggiense]
MRAGSIRLSLGGRRRPARGPLLRDTRRVRVSVVVAVFDPGPHLAPLLDSLRAQTLDGDEFEVVLVDDGSTDGTAAVLDAVASASRSPIVRTPSSRMPCTISRISVAARSAAHCGTSIGPPARSSSGCSRSLRTAPNSTRAACTSAVAPSRSAKRSLNRRIVSATA